MSDQNKDAYYENRIAECTEAIRLDLNGYVCDQFCRILIKVK